MVETKATIDKIVSELEDNKPTIQQEGKMSINQVMEILLDRNNGSTEGVGEVGAGNPEGVFDMGELKRWRDKNNQIYSIKLDRPLYSNRPVIGKVVVFVKKVTRKLLRPILYPILMEQNDFNGSVTASINALYNNELTTQQFINEQRAINETSVELQNRIKGFESQTESLESKIEQSEEQIKRLNEQIERLEEQVQRLSNTSYGTIDYERFESNFRGCEEDIKNRQSFYLPYFEGKKKVLDVGCGRGEFLQLLQENNIPASGVDAYAVFVEKCREKGLDVIEGDAIEYIKNLEESSVDGIFSAQLIEHLTTNEIVELCTEAFKKLSVGGCMILETPNPTCLSIYTNSFYIDPTHIKPIHPQFMEYLLKEAGFSKVEVVYTESSKVAYSLPMLVSNNVENLNDFNEGIKVLSDVIFGSQDYAIIATK